MGAHILVVEDEAHLAQGLLFNLRAEGYTAELAVDGETALEVIANNSIDAIILDVMLPGRDGFSVASELRAQQNFVPILMLTARGRPEDVLNGFSAGADDYLPKPFDLAILLARLNGLLRRMAWLRPEGAPAPVPPSRTVESLSTFTFAGRTIHFASLELMYPVQKRTPHLDGIRFASLPGAQPGTNHLPQGVVGTGLAGARGHGYARHRQLHRSSAPLHRRPSCGACFSRDSARRRLSFSARSRCAMGG